MTNDIMFDDLDFDDIDEVYAEMDEVEIEGDTTVINEEPVLEIEETADEVKEVEQHLEDKPKKKKATKLKAEIKDVVSKHQGNVDAQKAEAETAAEKRKAEKEAREAEIRAKMVYVDAQNVDDRKKIMDLMNEGRVIVDDKSKPFILAEQKTKMYNPQKAPIHKVYCDDVEHISIKNYWLDLETMPLGSRTHTKTVIWAYHKGYETFSMITQEQLDYLLDNGYITGKQVFYTHSDISTGASYFLDTDRREPDLNLVQSMEAKDIRIHEEKVGKRAYEESAEEKALIKQSKEVETEITDVATEEVTEELIAEIA